jgi:hypothetical protein
MSHFPARWNALAVVLALATLVGCQGVSTGKSNSQAKQTPLSGVLSAAPASISFGNVQVGTTQSQSDTLSNTGGTILTITQAAVSGSGFSTTGLNLPLTLGPGQSATFSIVFSPQSAGSASGNLALTNDSSTSPLNITLSGTAVMAGSLTGNPTSFSFGNVQVGGNQTQSETLKNSGSENLTISQATVSGAGFSYTGLSLPLTLAPNQSTTFAVVFAPTTTGASNGRISISINGSGTSLDIAVSGIGVTPATLTATPASLTFANVQVGENQTQAETVQNTGGSNGTISLATVTGAGFSISGLSTPVTLTPGQSTSFNVTFAPRSAGSFSGSVAITSNASNPNLTIALSGSGTAQTQGQLSVNPATINVGSVTLGTSGTQTATLNATGASVTVSSVSLGGANASEFSISGLSLPVTVTIGQPITFTVTFTPGATGAASASASFTSTASSSPTDATLTGTGTSAPVHSVALSWTASTSSGVTGYNVYRAVYKTNSCGSYSNIGSTPSSTTTYTDSVVADGTTYCYATTALEGSSESAYSNITQAKIPPP